MSNISVNNITNLDGSAGPTFSGITTISATGFMRVPVGNTFKRNVPENLNIVENGLILYLDAGNDNSYPGSGTTWTDLSGNGNTGTLINGPTYNSANGGSLVFDGVNDYTQLTSKFNFGTSDFSISCWAKFSTVSGNTNYRTILSSYASGGATDYIFGLFTTGVPKLQMFIVGVNVQGNTTLVSNTWYNLVATRASGIVSLYVNGILDNTPTSASGNLVENAIPRIGMVPSASQTGYFNGNLSNLLVYTTRALSAAEIQQNFNALRSRFGL